MYGREELDVNKLVYATDIDTMLVDCEGTEVWPQDSDGCEYYFKSQADSVMDAMETRIKELIKAKRDILTRNVELIGENAQLTMKIKELEEENKHLEDYIDAYQKSETINIEKLDKKDECIKELEKQNYVLNAEYDLLKSASEEKFKELEAVISKMETTTQKWISVKDRLPKGSPMLPALTEEGDRIWWGNWHDNNLEIYGITHWLDNAFPPPPTTEEK